MTDGGLHEYDSVELLIFLPAERTWFPDLDGDPHLAPGDRGAVVDLHPDGTAAVEFMRDGRTVALADVRSSEVRVLVANRPIPTSIAAPTD